MYVLDLVMLVVILTDSGFYFLLYRVHIHLHDPWLLMLREAESWVFIFILIFASYDDLKEKKKPKDSRLKNDSSMSILSQTHKRFLLQPRSILQDNLTPHSKRKSHPTLIHLDSTHSYSLRVITPRAKVTLRATLHNLNLASNLHKE